ncbi:sugar ABC transporter permease [Candidatus Sumerlaeota bacterium]|nr:sugar ABC transporter permease [Candidatus Sumerlaeota bacterium]
MNHQKGHSRLHLLFILPAASVYGIFVLYPFITTFFVSLHHWDGFGKMEFAGRENYYRNSARETLNIASDGVFHRALLNNTIYWIITLVTEVATGLALAALVARVGRGGAVYRLALSSPLMIALVASAVLWRQLLGDRGVFNSLLEQIGMARFAASWTGEKWVVYTVSVISGWAYAGFFMLIFHAGLERIPHELREAAHLDGASEWDIFRRIELPLLRPVLAVTVLMCSTGAFRAFDLFYVIVGTGKSSRNEVASTWLVKNAFTFRDFGYASSMAVVVVVIVMGLAAALSKWVSRERELEEF